MVVGEVRSRVMNITMSIQVWKPTSGKCLSRSIQLGLVWKLPPKCNPLHLIAIYRVDLENAARSRHERGPFCLFWSWMEGL